MTTPIDHQFLHNHAGFPRRPPNRGRSFICLAVLTAFIVTGCVAREIQRADQLVAQGDWDGAVEAYRQAVRKDRLNEAIQNKLDQAKARAAELHYAEGRRLLKQQRVPDAIQELKRALALAPSQGEHHAALSDAMQLKEAHKELEAAQKLEGLGRLDEALEAYERAVKLDPHLLAALEEITALTQQQRSQKAVGGSSEPITLRFQNTRLKELFEVLARAGRLNVVFDKDIKDDPITVFIKDMPLDDVLTMILSANNLFARRVGPDTLLVVPNTKQKREQYEDQMIRTFYLSNTKAKDMVNLLRTMLDSKRVFVNEAINSIVIRDRPEKIKLAERMILANDRRDSEVLLDVEVLELNRTKLLEYGLNFAKEKSGQAQFVGNVLKGLGPQSIVLTLPNSFTLDFLKSEADAKTLAAPKLRVLNNKQAKINVGDKQPILLSTSSVLPGSAFTGPSPTTSTVTSIEFKDVGVKVTVEPTIHLTDEITLKLTIEVTRVGEQVELQASPRIAQFKFGNREAETILNMKDDETVVLGGLIQDEDRKERSTIPWLDDIPWFGRLFGGNRKQTATTEIVLTITPHIVRNLSVPEHDIQTFWSGTETNYATQPLFSPVKPVSRRTSRSGGRQVQVPAGTGEGVRLSLLPSEVTALPKQEFQVDLTTEGVDPVGELTITVRYNPQVLAFRRALEGELVTRNGGTSSIVATPDAAAGQLHLVWRQGSPASANGVLTTLVFQAVSSGMSVLAIESSTMLGVDQKALPGIGGRGMVRVQ